MLLLEEPSKDLSNLDTQKFILLTNFLSDLQSTDFKLRLELISASIKLEIKGHLLMLLKEERMLFTLLMITSLWLMIRIIS